MMKIAFTLLLCLAASVASAYEKTDFQAYVDVRSAKKIDLVKEESDSNGAIVHRDKGRALWYTSPKLDNRWKTFSFIFVSGDDGQICLRFGPEGEGDIPFYYEDIRINGAPLDGAWAFHSPSREGTRQGSVISGKGEPVRIVAYFSNSVYRVINVKKGERVEVSMRAKSGSFLDMLNGRLGEVRSTLDEALRIGQPLQGSAWEAGRELEESLNQLSALSESKLHVSVAPLPQKEMTLEKLGAKTTEWIKAFEAEKLRTSNEERSVLYDKPVDQAALREVVNPAVQQAVKVHTACLLEFIFKR